jgi:acyl-CoA hydrolase
MSGKPPRLSHVEMTQVVLPGDANAHGNLFGGRLAQWIDVCAAVAAHRHAAANVVTANIDDLHFLAPVRVGDIVVLRSSVNYAGHTSMEVGVKVFSETPGNMRQHHMATAYLTFVAIDRRGKPCEVPPVAPETDDDRRRLREAKIRRTRRLQARRALLRRRQED